MSERRGLTKSRIKLQKDSYLQSEKIRNRKRAVMASEWDSLAPEINVTVPLNSGKHENEAICNMKGRLTDLIVHLLEMDGNIKFGKGALQSNGNEKWLVVRKHGKFLESNQGLGKEAKKGMETCFDREKERKHEPLNYVPYPTIFLGSFYDLGSFLFFLSLSWLLHFPTESFDFNLPNTSCCQSLPIKGLSSVWSLKQTSSTWSQHSVLERALVQMPASDPSSARSQLPSLGHTAQSHFSLPKPDSKTCPFYRRWLRGSNKPCKLKGTVYKHTRYFYGDF